MLTLLQAQQAVTTAIETATNNNQQVAVAVCDTHGELIAFAKMDEVSVQAGLLAKSKAYTSARDRQPSGNLGEWARVTGKDISYWNDPNITGFKGGVPILSQGRVVGAIGISGLSEEEDESLAQLSISELSL
ncbi:heme-binding protein [Vibrio sp. D404a]|uniref:GlcG/HbpS family heme-binding protein n=1 Tax=unclassified Vibrio TaxID=2614977 RepID=UPI0025576D4E|nr:MULTISPECIES: heme-binding protein [unclassified Vibrio]MDK9739071.1 heme-binding protein [Vibrio sp. D404a]MDK9796604.1 heme-binding protein [Vibrio sp. D449a]